MTRVLSIAMAGLMAVTMLGCETGPAAPAGATTEPLARDLGPQEPILLEPEAIDWQEGPASLPAGAEMAILEGDPSASGLFTMRLRAPAGYVIPPHWHPNVERVTVIQGTFHLGHGEVFNEDALEPLPAGSYFAMPPQMRHFAVAEGETIVQITSVGPWDIRYVDPADDPRRN